RDLHSFPTRRSSDLKSLRRQKQPPEVFARKDRPAAGRARHGATGKDCRARPSRETNRRQRRAILPRAVAEKRSAAGKAKNKCRRRWSQSRLASKIISVRDRFARETAPRQKRGRSTCREES